MKKTLILTVTAALLVLSSCTNQDEREIRDNRLAGFCGNLVELMADGSVDALGDLLSLHEARLFSEGFDTTFTTADGLHLNVSKPEEPDSTWDVVCDKSNMNLTFNSRVQLLKSLPRDFEHRWNFVGEGFYDEENGYTCELSCKDGKPAIYHWERSGGSSYYSPVIYNLVRTGDFIAISRHDGKTLDRAELHYRNNDLSYTIRRSN